jgi:hypothetical protein
VTHFVSVHQPNTCSCNANASLNVAASGAVPTTTVSIQHEINTYAHKTQALKTQAHKMQAPHWKMTPEITLLALMALERLHAAHLFLCRKCSHNILPLHNLQYGLNLPCSHVRRLLANAVTVNEGELMRSCTGILFILLKILFMSVI